jgi:hypothetical protein
MRPLIDAFRKIGAAIARWREPPPPIHPELQRLLDKMKQSTGNATEFRRAQREFRFAFAMLERQLKFQRELGARLSKFVAEYNAKACPALRRGPV